MWLNLRAWARSRSLISEGDETVGFAATIFGVHAEDGGKLLGTGHEAQTDAANQLLEAVRWVGGLSSRLLDQSHLRSGADGGGIAAQGPQTGQ